MKSKRLPGIVLTLAVALFLLGSYPVSAADGDTISKESVFDTANSDATHGEAIYSAEPDSADIDSESNDTTETDPAADQVAKISETAPEEAAE